MYRKTPWRHALPDSVSFRQDQALATTMRVLKSYGPTAFLLQEDGEAHSYKVCLGDPHTCTCPVFTEGAELCKHICWILLQQFRLPRGHQYSFQLGLLERQLLELLEGSHQLKAKRGQPGAGSICRKGIEPQDVCPICLEELLRKRLPVSHCRFGCGNSVHISCMTIWAEKQRVTDVQKSVKCPLCRSTFSSLVMLKMLARNATKLFTAAEQEKPDRHLGVSCYCCRLRPITGRCFKCTVCSYMFLCEACMRSHLQHPLAFKTSRTEDWRLWLEGELKGATCQEGVVPVAMDPLPEHVLEGLPVKRVEVWSQLLNEGVQCRLCLESFKQDQCVRNLPCNHKFHTECVDPILRESNACPLDGYVLYSAQMTSPHLLEQANTSNETQMPNGSLRLKRNGCGVKTALTCGCCEAQKNDGGAKGHTTSEAFHVQGLSLQVKVPD